MLHTQAAAHQCLRGHWPRAMTSWRLLSDSHTHLMRKVNMHVIISPEVWFELHVFLLSHANDLLHLWIWWLSSINCSRVKHNYTFKMVCLACHHKLKLCVNKALQQSVSCSFSSSQRDRDSPVRHYATMLSCSHMDLPINRLNLQHNRPMPINTKMLKSARSIGSANQSADLYSPPSFPSMME